MIFLSHLLGVVDDGPVLGRVGVERAGQRARGRAVPLVLELATQLLVALALLLEQALAFVQDLGVAGQQLGQLGDELLEGGEAAGLDNGRGLVLQGLGDVLAWKKNSTPCSMI